MSRGNAMALGCGPTGRGLKVAGPADGVTSPSMQLSRVFPYQSYFDTTLLEKAILEQQAGKIVAEQKEQQAGYGIGLHPSSETPVAVSVFAGKAGGGTKTYTLKPGQVIYPTGSKGFEGFSWGLPFGWLGGGVANLHVFQTPDADVQWGGGGELVFHRVRVPILQPADVTAAANDTARKNWPSRFPWTQAVRGANSASQKGQPQIGIVEPTRTLMALRGANALAAAASMRIVVQGSNRFSFDSAGEAVMTTPVFVDVTWRQYAQLGTSGKLISHDIAMEAPSILNHLGADDGGVALIDNSGGGSLNGLYVDFVRLGKL